MKRLLLFFLYFIFSLSLFSQPKYDFLRDQVWVTGRYYSSLDSVSLIWLDFSEDTMALISKFKPGAPIDYTNASICDKDGGLLMYSNGCSIRDTNYQVIPGGDMISFGPSYE